MNQNWFHEQHTKPQNPFYPGQQRRTHVRKETTVKWTLTFGAYVTLQLRYDEHTTFLMASLIVNKHSKLSVKTTSCPAVESRTNGVAVWYVVLVNVILYTTTLLRRDVTHYPWLVSPTCQFHNDALHHPICVPQVATVCSELDINLVGSVL
jgi:hypothetical protein